MVQIVGELDFAVNSLQKYLSEILTIGDVDIFTDKGNIRRIISSYFYDFQIEFSANQSYILLMKNLPVKCKSAMVNTNDNHL